jgi:hypothetical protein
LEEPEPESAPILTKFTIKSVFKTFNQDSKFIPLENTTVIVESQTPLIHKYMNKLDPEILKKSYFDFSKSFSNHYNVEITEPGTTLEESWYVGRVLCDSITGHDSLNSESILFESLSQEGQSHIVRLKTDQYEQLYSGQLIGVFGIWSKSLLVKEIKFGIPAQVQSGIVLESFKMAVIQGPFEDRLDEMLTNCLDTNLIVLIGPFLESTTTSYLEKFESICSKIKMKTILIPSTNDVFHHYVFPQPKLDTCHDLICLSNPCLFTVNGLSIGCTSNDVLSHIKINKMELALEQFLNQNTFYPFFGINGLEPIDWNLIQNVAIPKMPQIMLMPSSRPFLIQSIQNVLFINPKRGGITKISVSSGNTCLERIKVEMFSK